MTFNDCLERWFKGDAEAVAFALTLWDASQKWDDIEDEGQCESRNALLAWLAFGKEYTGYFAKNAHLLRPAMLNMYLQWIAANTLERGTREDCDKAFMLRAGIYGVFHLMAWIAGGHDWAEKIGPEIYRQYAETADGLWKEMNNA